MEEVWKPIRGYVGLYEISNYGRVRSLDRVIVDKNGITRNIKGRVMKLYPDSSGYYNVELTYNCIGKGYLVHKLVATTFIPNPDNLPEVNHKSECKIENFVWVNPDGTVDTEKSNLEWCTHDYNINYGTNQKRKSMKMLNNKIFSIPVNQYSLSGEFIKDYPSAAQAKRETGINSTQIRACCLKKNGYHTAGGFIWKQREV